MLFELKVGRHSSPCVDFCLQPLAWEAAVHLVLLSNGQSLHIRKQWEISGTYCILISKPQPANRTISWVPSSDRACATAMWRLALPTQTPISELHVVILVLAGNDEWVW